MDITGITLADIDALRADADERTAMNQSTDDDSYQTAGTA